MRRTRIKICGITTPETALAAVECGADAVGLVFAEGSPRKIEPRRAWEIAAYLPPFVSKVGLFVNPSAVHFFKVKEACPFDYGQLHGEEGVKTVQACGPWIIKAIRFDQATIEQELARWNAVDDVEAVLIDGSAGGLGTKVDWSALASVAGACDHPIILAGGLAPDNVEEAIRIVRPYAVDVSSGVERERGVKDPALIRAFCEAVRRADADLPAPESE